MNIRTGVLAACLGLLAACTSVGPDFSMAEVDRMKPGVTSLGQAQQALGQPTTLTREADGSTRAGWARAETMGPVTSSRAVMILFGPDGRMVRVISRGQSGWNGTN